MIANDKSIQDTVNHLLHNPTSPSFRLFNGMIVFLIIFSVALIPVHFLPGSEWADGKLLIIDKFIITIFTIEYVLRIWSAKYPWKYISSSWGILDLVAILPFYLVLLGILPFSEPFLVVRLVRTLKLGKIYQMEKLALSGCKVSLHGEFRLVEDEKVERVVQKHPLIFLLELLIPLSLSMIGLLAIFFFQLSFLGIGLGFIFLSVALLFFIRAWLDYNYDVIYITDRRVILQTRELFGATSNDVAYEAITNVVPTNKGILYWFFNLGDLCIETAARDGILNFKYAPLPHEIVQHIASNRQRVLKQRMSVNSFGPIV